MNFSKTLSIVLAIMVIGLAIRYFYLKPRFVNGEAAPDFVSYLPSGDSIQLSDFRGEYVLLDFWGSWCGPCRQENPKLVKLYEKYGTAKFKDIKGFKIISVGIETSKERWMNAIRKDGLRWPHHVSDLKNFKSETALLFGVREIPTKYLLNEKGVIIGVNQTFGELDKILASHQ